MAKSNTEKTKKHKFDSEVQSWRFPRLLEITREWLANVCPVQRQHVPTIALAPAIRP